MTDTAKNLSNDGIVFKNGKTSGANDKIFVVGVARGGTSMVAGTLHHLGLPLGGNVNSSVFEDVALGNAILNGNRELIAELIGKYDQQHERWAFKRPNVAKMLKKVEDMLENTSYIFVFKDLLAISRRREISAFRDSFEHLDVSMQLYAELVDLVQTTNNPSMLVSYEKAILNKAKFIAEVTKFCQLSPTREQKTATMAFIDPNSEQYLESSRTDQHFGRIGAVRKTKVRGWAKYKKSDEPVTVLLEVNNRTVGAAIADQLRKNLKGSKEHGFEFDLEVPLVPGDKVAVFIDDKKKQELKDSPKFFRPND